MLDHALIASLRPDLLRFAQLQLRDAALAEDAVQDALTAAITGDHQFAGRSAVKTWVFGILRNKIVDLIRQDSRSTNLSALIDAEGEALDEAYDALFKANAHWHPATRPSVWRDPEDSLQDQQFWTVFEVCQELSLTTSNCHVILHRARNGLRRCLENGWFAPGERPC